MTDATTTFDRLRAAALARPGTYGELAESAGISRTALHNLLRADGPRRISGPACVGLWRAIGGELEQLVADVGGVEAQRVMAAWRLGGAGRDLSEALAVEMPLDELLLECREEVRE